MKVLGYEGTESAPIDVGTAAAAILLSCAQLAPVNPGNARLLIVRDLGLGTDKAQVVALGALLWAGGVALLTEREMADCGLALADDNAQAVLAKDGSLLAQAPARLIARKMNRAPSTKTQRRNERRAQRVSHG